MRQLFDWVRWSNSNIEGEIVSYLIAFVMYCNTASFWTTNRSCLSELIRCHLVFKEGSKTALEVEADAALCMSYEAEYGTGGWRDQVTNKEARKKWGLDR